ncbi:lipopolysaccharide biosynthesis protein [Ureibacillus chungkukjangi]|uniref:O-antigen/teichoic acid export membrane protein n=1 Tax=Ureibacillus chungkukjangi TaxID=1202712 RepID=A0A318TQ65_9BACL|nr:lipopolysaccharide biosynthesis protein [Ureibacillus chungkukjangi]MCM3386877.1 lipopolysaccharide biosynthesis protein [Ureibacillus chungkukjangi]PYF06057.1 O-antigen/teichoic acid export membrane protein [Ureibacillus chungkukjangi]
MEYDITKSKVISSLFWKLLERGGVYGIQFIVMVLLARLLLPEEFGIIVLVTVFISLANLLAQSGLNTALIQKKSVDDTDFSSAFYTNLLISTILYILLYFTSPFIAAFFDESQLINLIRLLSLTLFIGSFTSIQNAIIARNMQFRKLFFSSLCAAIIAGAVGIGMAFADFGLWALVWHQLTYQLLAALILLFTVDWRPKLLFSWKRVKGLFSYGWKLMVSAVIDTLYANLMILSIGKFFSPAIVGFYNRGEQFPNLIINNINGSIQSVMLPALSAFQDDKKRIKEMVRRSIVTSSYIIFPMMVGLAVIAKPLVIVLLTEKWLPSVPFIQIFCGVYALWPIHTANLQAMNALGRSDIYLKLEIVKKIVGIAILAICIPFGVHAMAIGALVGGVVATFINTYPNSKLFDYSFQEQWRDLFPSLTLSLLMGAFVYPIQWIGLSAPITLMTQMFLGVLLYVVLSNMFKMESFSYLLTTTKELLWRRKRKSNYSIHNEV